MRNTKVYEIANSRPITIDITRARWKLWGHVLRLDEKTPARKAMRYFFIQPTNPKKFRGRKRKTIVTTLNRDIERTNKLFRSFDIKPMKTELDLRNVRVKATNRNAWRRRVDMVVKAAYSTTAF